MTPWVKLDNDYYDHRKFAQAGPLTELLWVRMLAWSHRNLTDGVVPIRAIKRLCDFLCEVGEIEPTDDPFETKGVELTWVELVDRGVEAGLFEAVDDEGTAMRVHDYTAKQNTADLVEKRRDAGRRGGIKSGQVRQKWQPNEANGEANGQAEGKQSPSKGEAEGKQVLKQNGSRGQASAEPDVRCQITDTPPPLTNGFTMEAPTPEEEEEEVERKARAAAAVLAERALKARRGEPLNDPRSWLAKVAGERYDEHHTALYVGVEQDPEITPHQLASLIEAGGPKRPPPPRCEHCVGGWVVPEEGGDVVRCEHCTPAKARARR